jgi:hypothetical protein
MQKCLRGSDAKRLRNASAHLRPVLRNLTAADYIKSPDNWKLLRRDESEGSVGAVVGGICAGTILYYVWRRYQELRRIRNFHFKSEDFNYPNLSSDDLASQHLIDLNATTSDQFSELGISPESLERLLDNRPYRKKLELVSRMVLSPNEYSSIKDRVAVAQAGESVKIGVGEIS